MKVVSCMVIDGDQACGGENSVVYIDVYITNLCPIVPTIV